MKKGQKMIALLMCLLMLLGTVPVSALAALTGNSAEKKPGDPQRA